MKSTDRSERVLALLLLEQMKAATQKDKVLKLNLAGFSNLEIADILQLTSLQVAQILYGARQVASAKRKTIKKSRKSS